MTGTFDGKVVLVTGVCGDIGSTVARMLLAEGADVVGTDWRDLGEAEKRFDLNAIDYVRADMRDPMEIDRLVDTACSRHGRIDALVAAAGVATWSKALDVTVEDWDQTMEVNLRGAFLTARQVAAAMVDSGRRGAMVLVGSWVGVAPSAGLLPYCVSKAGLEMVARCLSLELGPSGIRVNVVAPGVIDAGVSAQIFKEVPARRAALTAVVPLGDLGSAEQVAAAVAFLLSPSAAYITGTALVVDGGMGLAYAGG